MLPASVGAAFPSKVLAQLGCLCQYTTAYPPYSQEEPTFGAVEPVTLIPAAFIILAASLTKSTAGFGFALVGTPFLLLFWEPRVVISILLPLVTTVDVMIVFQGRRRLEWGRVLPMVVAGAVGIPLGTVILLAVPQRALKLGIAGVVLVFAVLLLVGYTLTIRRERVAGGVAGFFSGLALTSTSISGPPVTLFMINQRWTRDTFRTSQGLFHLTTDVLGIVSLGIAQVITGETLLVDLSLLPMVLLGYWLATLVLPHLRQELFLRLVTFIVIGAAVLGIGSELARL